MFNLILQTQSILASLSDARERVRIAIYLINRLAELLNESRDELIQQAESSRQQLIAVSRAIKDLDMGSVEITFYRTRYISPMLHNANGSLLQFSLEGQLRTGSLYGLHS